MSIPNYILTAARAYADEHNGGRELEDAFVAGYAASKQRKKKDVLPQETQPELFDECWKAYGRKGSRASSLSAWCNLTADERSKILAHIRIYTTTRDKCYMKDFERYLAHKTFNDVILGKNGMVVYDPAQSEQTDEYQPLADGIFNYWDAENKRLIFNGDINNLDDGYNSDNRPEGATAYWNGYSWKWSKEQKTWVKQ